MYILYMYMENVYSTLALEKEREIVKEETALRKEKEAVCCYVHVHVYMYVHVPTRSAGNSKHIDGFVHNGKHSFGQGSFSGLLSLYHSWAEDGRGTSSLSGRSV